MTASSAVADIVRAHLTITAAGVVKGIVTRVATLITELLAFRPTGARIARARTVPRSIANIVGGTEQAVVTSAALICGRRHAGVGILVADPLGTVAIKRRAVHGCARYAAAGRNTTLGTVAKIPVIAGS